MLKVRHIPFVLILVASPAFGAPFVPVTPQVSASLQTVASAVPKPNPRRADPPHSDGRLASAVPVPKPRPGRANVVAKLDDGTVVPVAPAAFAEPAPETLETLVEAVHGAAAGREPAAPPPSPTAASVPAPSFPGGKWSEGPLRTVLDALKADRYDRVHLLRDQLSDPLDRTIVDYFLIRSGHSSVSAAMVADFMRTNRGWATPKAMQAALETALLREGTDPAAAVRLIGEPTSSAGVRLAIRAKLAAGDRAGARSVLTALWHARPLGADVQMAMAKEFGDVLTLEDHLTRIDALIAKGRFEEAGALRPRLGTGPRAYLSARLAAARGAADASKQLEAIPNAYADRPGARLAKAEALRHDDKFEAAAKILLAEDPGGIVDGDAWWTEARIVGRSLAERGEAVTAYELAAKGFASSNRDRADEAFHAGWFALVGKKDGKLAETHFKALEDDVSFPISLARAAHWRARAAALRGDDGAASRFHREAARYGFTYYGQLSREALRMGGTGVSRGPRVTATDRAAIAQNAIAEAVRRLSSVGHGHRLWPLLDHLSETVPTAGQVALVSQLARDAGHAHLALMVAKEGQRRGLDVGRLAYPTTEIPKSATVPVGLDRALVYAIARQESLFNTDAVSPAGARGLMQVMPRTAASMARELGLSHSTAKLTRDPAYNATLGAAYLAKRLSNFNGSYILTFAAYNAGAGRVYEWIERFGDPRDPGVDAVQWVEQIPFPETRNYVMRVLENVQVYREALGSGRLAILDDLARGRPS